MEQRIGSSSQPLEGEPVVKGAGFDPAFIPGLTSPASGEPEGAEPSARPEDAEPAAPETEESPAAASPADEAAGEPAPEEVPDGPVFEASDRRARIVADHRGVRLSLDDQECDFRWDEVAAVETETARFGKRFTVTVHTPDRRWYPIEIDAPSRGRFQEWDARLDEVLDAYFEDGDGGDGGGGDTEEPGDAKDTRKAEEPGGSRAAGTDGAGGAGEDPKDA
ncbi:hypothetical protein [Streptomyces cyaneogriseus]|uniref:hypothetical protein n=1 Tax=Streptomyces cyaneogriseus TaxID=68192 RepID=UPI001EF0F51B|nr:hypothetical protein [Streptomyces cyaneogriseus]